MMRKRIIAFLVAFAVSVIPVHSWAHMQETPVPEGDPEYLADVAETVSGTDDIITEVEEEKGGYVIEGDRTQITVPDEGSGDITMTEEAGTTITMCLPDTFAGMDGELAGEGSIVFSDEESDASAMVQGVQEETGGISAEGVRSLITISSADAPHEYVFDFVLPAGCSLMTAEEYRGDRSDAGCVYIVDEQSEIAGVIDPAWAKDAEGQEVKTEYRVRGSRLTQLVAFDDRTPFPVVADPKVTQKPKAKKVGSRAASTRISHSLIGLGSFAGGTVSKGLTKAAKKKVTTAIAAKLGSKFIPVISAASWAMVGYATLASCKGYNYTKVHLKYEKWTCYSHQGGKWVKGYQLKGKKLTLKLVK